MQSDISEDKPKVKPIVNYYVDFPHNYVVEGNSAIVWAIDHPDLGNELVRTSTVLKDCGMGVFETKNTFYVGVTGWENDEAI